MFIIRNPEVWKNLLESKGKEFEMISKEHDFSILIYSNKAKLKEVIHCDKKEKENLFRDLKSPDEE